MTINASTEKVLHIGKQGENAATLIDFSDYAERYTADYGKGVLALVHQRAQDEAPYAVSLTNNCWCVMSADLQYPGTGLCELTWTVNMVVKKSLHWKTLTLSALGETVDPPAAWQGYIDTVTGLVAEIENMTVSAETLEPGSEATVTKTTENSVVHLTFGLPQGEKGEKGEDGKDGKDGAAGEVSKDTIISALGYTPASNDQLNAVATDLANAKQNKISDLDTIRSGAALGATALQTVPSTYRTAAAQDTIDATKQDVISDLEDIRSGAARGKTSLQKVPDTYRTAIAQDAIDVKKQDTLISGSNIKTINGESVLGDGDLTVTGSEKEWVLKGALTGSKTSASAALTLDLTGCTELMLLGPLTATNSASSSQNVAIYITTASGNVALTSALAVSVSATASRYYVYKWHDLKTCMAADIYCYATVASPTISTMFNTSIAYTRFCNVADITGMYISAGSATITSAGIGVWAR